ncbi:MAG: DUF6259 domain-containing protein [Terracidiphilus sp.]
MAVSRRKFLGTALGAGAAGFIAAPVSPAAAQPGLVNLSSEFWDASIDRATGCIASLESRGQGWKLKGAGMRLHVPAPDHRFHYLTEHHAAMPRVEFDARHASITWNGFESDRLGSLDIEVRQSIRLEGAGIHFNYEIYNSSQAVIESYTYPRLAGLRPAGNDRHLRHAAWSYSGISSIGLWPIFGNEVGYWGSDTPAQLQHLGTDIQFCLIVGDTRGLYLGYHDPGQKQTVQVCFALAPAYVDSFSSNATDAAGKVSDSTISIDPNHLCFIQPGGTQRSEPLVFETFAGDWHAGADIYKAWRRTWFTAPKSPTWVRDIHSWQQIQINSSEDRLEFPYKDLVRHAEACKRWGVQAIQLTGWQKGGQDRDFPLHDIDPRLGTAQEFKDAIAASRAMGVEIVLFNKYAWADVTAPDYPEFRKYAIQDPYGNPYQFNGYNYDTPTQISGINARHGVGMCQASPLWRERALQEFRKSVDLGASGILFDECQWHLSPYCFARDHGHGVPGAVFSGDVPLIEGFRAIVDPEQFLFAGESPYDIELRTYDMSYFRIGAGFVPFGRYIDPFAPMSVAITGWNDRQTINACLLYRFSMSYEPRDFHGELGEMPETLKYGRAVDDLRRRYREWLWDAEFRDTLGAGVTVANEPHNAYSVFRCSDGRCAIVAANMSHTGKIVCEYAFDSPRSAEVQFVSVEHPDPKRCPAGSVKEFELAPGSAMVILET